MRCRSAFIDDAPARLERKEVGAEQSVFSEQNDPELSPALAQRSGCLGAPLTAQLMQLVIRCAVQLLNQRPNGLLPESVSDRVVVVWVRRYMQLPATKAQHDVDTCFQIGAEELLLLAACCLPQRVSVRVVHTPSEHGHIGHHVRKSCGYVGLERFCLVVVFALLALLHFYASQLCDCTLD